MEEDLAAGMLHRIARLRGSQMYTVVVDMGTSIRREGLGSLMRTRWRLGFLVQRLVFLVLRLSSLVLRLSSPV